jgi:hypothetical protein
MPRRLIVLVAVAIVAGLASLAAAAPTDGPPPPPPNSATINAFWANLASLSGTKGSYGSFDVDYDVASQQLHWSIDYINTTGPATDLRLRMRLTKGILSLSLCKPGCVSKTVQGKHGPYFHMGGTIVRPPRDLLLMATEQAGADLLLMTQQYPRGELRVVNVSPVPVSGGTGGHCC